MIPVHVQKHEEPVCLGHNNILADCFKHLNRRLVAGVNRINNDECVSSHAVVFVVVMTVNQNLELDGPS